ncbi:MAG: L,D-transpeptidase family protein [Rhodospirillales bacterium]|nr:L,D-transpeptidase family protein [Rhodospirillales bacterium]
MELIVTADGFLNLGGASFRCALGRGGVFEKKAEGDGRTPVGTFPLRNLYYRNDRLAQPATGLPTTVITGDDGWCDDAGCADYNKFVSLPHTGRFEHLMREDGLYDVVIAIGFNDAPVIAGRGSAIFMHVAAPGYTPTEGCVALALDDLLTVAAACNLNTALRILSP